MTHVVNGVVWKSRWERQWGHFLLEYTEMMNHLTDLCVKMMAKKQKR